MGSWNPRGCASAKSGEGDPAFGDGDNVADFAEKVERLVDVESDLVFSFNEIDDPMQAKLDDAENRAAGNGPDDAGVNQSVRGEAVHPDGRRVAVVDGRAGLVAAVFVERQILTL